MSNKIELKAIYELLGMNFFIPSYQRGYRWNRQQVKDLLGDIQEFIDNKKEGFYCIQPLVVKRSIPDTKINAFKMGLEKIKTSPTNQTLVEQTEKLISETTQWEVIDGQQRLTTIYILLQHLDSEKKSYTLEYQTRDMSKSFLENIDISESKDNIDFYHIAEAKDEIIEWFVKKDVDYKLKFLDTLLKDVQFIWYESIDEDPVKVFTRLNVGKISLTNAELIKALFLNKSNFHGSNQRVTLQQNEIAIEWDQIEYTLQNDEFWLFLHEIGYEKPTRIDFIFDLMVDKDTLKLKPKSIGNDEHKTFRYFYEWFKTQKEEEIEISKCWNEVKTIFHTFQEWFNDIELYHYIGFLVEKEKTKKGIEISEVLDNWKKTKNGFKSDYLYGKIKEKIGNKKTDDLERINSKEDSYVRPILLLHNIQTVITQNKTLTENDKYKLPLFYKFPFHLFKKESWDIEHIDSNTENELGNIKDQKEWLKYSFEFVPKDAKMTIATRDTNSTPTEANLKDEIEKFIKNKENKSIEIVDFMQLYDNVILSTSTQENKLTYDEKNRLWNFAWLDSSTNRGYGNAIFPAKRRILIGKDQGVDLKSNNKDRAIAFIPPCTKNVFLKYYNPMRNNLREWDKTDAQAYLENIKKILNTFLQ